MVPHDVNDRQIDVVGGAGGPRAEHRRHQESFRMA
jgi:hypothetical protein